MEIKSGFKFEVCRGMTATGPLCQQCHGAPAVVENALFGFFCWECYEDFF